MRSEVMQRIIDEMEKDPWWVKLKRWMKVEWWFIVCKTRKYWDKEFINRRNHIAHCTIRREIAMAFPFMDIRSGEDYAWATAIHNAGLIKTEVKIEKELYHYQFKTNK